MGLPSQLYELNPNRALATWQLLYSAREDYAPLVPSLPLNAPLTPAFWHNLTDVYYKNDTAFQTYIAHKHRGWEFVRNPCVGACKDGTLCEMRTLRADVCVRSSGIGLVGGSCLTLLCSAARIEFAASYSAYELCARTGLV